MAVAPSTGSSVSGADNGQEQNLTYGSTRILADGSFAKVSASAAIWNYKNLTQSATTTVKTGAGQLYGFYVGTAAGNITIYDNTAASGAKILDTSAVPAAGATYVLPASFGTGLTVVLSGAAVVTALYL